MELWHGLLICPIIKLLILPIQLIIQMVQIKKYIDDNYLKSGGTVTGHVILTNAILASQYQAISRNTGNAFFVQIINPYV